MLETAKRLPLLASAASVASAVLLGLIPILAPVSARADHPSVGLGSGVAGPIITIPASTLPAGKWAVSARLEWISFHTFSDSQLVRFAENGVEAHSTASVTSPSLSVAYGVTRTFTLGARLPYVARRDIREGHLEGTIGEVHHHGDSRGVGDLTVMGEFLVWEQERAKIAVITGVKAPTGRTTVGGADRLETEHQPGSGSWDWLEGISWSGRVPFGSIDANMLTTFASQGAQETNLGTLFTYNASIAAKVAGGHEHHHEGVEGGPGVKHHDGVGADLILELNGEARTRQKIAGVRDPNSGGNLVYLSPGVRFGPERWSASFSFGVPILQNLNGTQHETDWRMLVGFGTSF
jgi:outer membrane putative beta-barrel porin/alpha-amylase